MTDNKKPKQAKPVLVEIYCVVANSLTSKGRAFHGDTVSLPKDEAAALIKKGDFK